MHLRRTITPDSRLFTILMSVTMAMTALGIDTVLPAFDDIRADFGLPSDANDVAGLVTAYIVGFGLGQFPAGLLADRYGRRQVLWGGLVLYVIGAAVAAVAPSLAVMTFGRFIWGLGAAGPRVAVTAMVRDAYQGADMARQMSQIMAIFLLIPMIAPAVGAALLHLGPWQLTIWLCVAVAGLVAVASIPLPSAIPEGQRQSLALGDIGRAWKAVITTPGSLGFIIAPTAMTAAFTCYIASSENIYDETFGLKSWFAFLYAVGAVGLMIANLLNSRLVGRVGLRRLLHIVPFAQAGVTAVLVAVVLATDGVPPVWVFLPLIVVVFTAQHVTIVNSSSAAMIPLGHVAGTAAALVGAIPQIVGSLVASWIASQYDGTVTPLTLAFAASALITVVSIGHALRVTPEH